MTKAPTRLLHVYDGLHDRIADEMKPVMHKLFGDDIIFDQADTTYIDGDFIGIRVQFVGEGFDVVLLLTPIPKGDTDV